MRSELDEAVDRVLRSGRFVGGEEVERFEEEFAAHCGVAYAVGVASGTDAITIALQALDVGTGDEVVTAANTCVPTVAGIEASGARAVLVDADPETFTLDPARLEEALTPRTKAIVPVHLYGRCADMAAIGEVARRRGIAVVEDCAQAHGAEYDGRRAGSLGDAAAFSFYPTKNLGALGDGGIVVTGDAEVARRARLLRSYGEDERFQHVLRGRNSRLDALQAAMLHLKLPHLDEWNERRRAIAAAYGANVIPGHVYHLYVVRSDDRDAFRARLAEHGVDTDVHYPRAIHQQPGYESLAPTERSLAVSEELAASVVSIPLYPELIDDEVAHVAHALSASR